MQVHRRGIASRQDERCAFAQRRTDGTEDVGRSGALIGGRRRPRATPGPATGDPVLLPDPGFVSEPDLYRGRLDAFVLRDLCPRWQGNFFKMRDRSLRLSVMARPGGELAVTQTCAVPGSASAGEC